MAVTDDEFGRTAANVEDACGPFADRIPTRHSEMDESRLFRLAEHVDRDTARSTNRRQELVTVGGFAHGRAEVAGAGGAGRARELYDRGDAALDRFFAEVAAQERCAAAETHHLARLEDRARRAEARIHLDDDQMDRVGPHVDRAE